jgi:hypothetical protein
MKTLTLVANNRLHYLSQMVESLKENNFDGYTLYIGVEPDDESVVAYCQDLDFMPIHLTINAKRLGVGGNPLATISRAFDAGSEFNVALEDDLILSPDALDLANWFYALPSVKNYLCLNLFNYKSAPEHGAVVEEAHHFVPLGWAATRRAWQYWIKPNWTGDVRGWDFAVNKAWESTRRIKLLQPRLSRANHLGREGGVHCSTQYHDKTFAGLAISGGTQRGYHLQAEPPVSGSSGQRAVKIKLVTWYDVDMAEVGEITSRIQQEYAQKHGYTAIRQTGTKEEYRAAPWNKIAVLRQAMQCDWCEWLMWLDADAVIANMDVTIESIIAQIPNGKEVAFGTDDNGLCTGVFLIRNSPWSRSFLEAVWFLKDVNFEHEYGDGRRWEQNCIKALAKHFKSVGERIYLFPQRWMNSYEEHFQDGDFILHLASRSNEQRLARLRQLVEARTLRGGRQGVLGSPQPGG